VMRGVLGGGEEEDEDMVEVFRLREASMFGGCLR
jgi:hypothetical protein